jgi:hypothetical protein
MGGFIHKVIPPDIPVDILMAISGAQLVRVLRDV